MSWKKDKVFKSGASFVKWLEKNFGSYIKKHISELHVHHTWKPNHSNSQSALQLHKNMRNYHVNTRGWSDIGQHISIGKNGDVVTGRSIKVSPASAFGHNGNSNWHPFMFEMIADFDKGRDNFSGKQFDTVMAISRYFDNLGKPIKFHREMDSRKSCPGNGISKSWFMSQVRGKKGKPSKSKPSKPSSSETSNTGGSVVDYMKSKGMDSSYPNRKRLAKKYGIKEYSGTESQNIKLLNKLKGGKPAKSKKSSTSLPSGVLRRGSRGNNVKQLQRALNKAYFKVGKVDGIYGARTQDAVERFQKVFDAYHVDGVYGPRTKKRLEKVLK